MLLKSIILCLFFASLTQAYAFSWKKCDDEHFTYADLTGGLVFTSSSQYTSSWGPCSALAHNSEQKRKIFFVRNVNVLKKEISQGRGEILTEYLNLNFCHESSYLNIVKSLKDNFASDLDIDLAIYYTNLNRNIQQFCKMG